MSPRKSGRWSERAVARGPLHTTGSRNSRHRAPGARRSPDTGRVGPSTPRQSPGAGRQSGDKAHGSRRRAVRGWDLAAERAAERPLSGVRCQRGVQHHRRWTPRPGAFTVPGTVPECASVPVGTPPSALPALSAAYHRPRGPGTGHPEEGRRDSRPSSGHGAWGSGHGAWGMQHGSAVSRERLPLGAAAAPVATGGYRPTSRPRMSSSDSRRISSRALPSATATTGGRPTRL